MKNRKTGTLRIAGGLLALVMITSCFVGGTFAKYTVGGKGTDTARVAKFGVTVTANGATFADTYATHTGNVVGTIANSVVSADGSNLVAPGTSGNMVSMTLSGKPEVAVQVTYNATVTFNGNWKDAQGKFYCPLQIKIPYNDPEWGEITATFDGHGYNSAAALKKDIEDQINAFSAKYPAGTDLSAITADGSLLAPSVSWAWSYYDTDANDVKDTYLGDQAAKGNAATITLEVTTTVTQID